MKPLLNLLTCRWQLIQQIRSVPPMYRSFSSHEAKEAKFLSSMNWFSISILFKSLIILKR